MWAVIRDVDVTLGSGNAGAVGIRFAAAQYSYIENVSVDATGKIFLQDQQVELPELVAKLQAIAQNNQDRRIFVRGDKDLAYGRIMEVMGTITQGGFTKVALLAEQPIAQPAKPAAAAPPKAG